MPLYINNTLKVLFENITGHADQRLLTVCGASNHYFIKNFSGNLIHTALQRGRNFDHDNY